MVARETTLRSNQTRHARNGVRIKTIALPAEHGGWGLVLEPLVLGLLLAPRLAIAAMLVLTLRALIAFALARRYRPTAMQLGFSEIAFGALTVIAVAFGSALHM